MRRKILLILLALVFLAMACYGASQLLLQGREYRAGEEAYDALAQYVQAAEPSPAQTGEPDKAEQPPQSGTPAGEEGSAPAEEIAWPVVDFAALQAVNPDVVAWIFLEGTFVNYPVVRGEDNSEYLHRLVDGTYNRMGSIFMDYRNAPDLSQRHTVLYGHNMKNQSMFALLMDYKEQTFYDAHPTWLILTPGGNYKLELFAGYVADLDGEAWKLSFGSDEEYAAWLEQAAAASTFVSTVTPTTEDRVVTLSTCSYEYDNARYVLVGVLTPQ